MASETRDYKIKVTTDGIQQATRSFSSLQSSIITINQAVQLAQTAFSSFTSATKQLGDALNLGGQIQTVSTAFQNLQKAAGLDATESIQKLRKATLGLVDDFTLLKQANNAVQLGIDPKILDTLAESATKLGRAVGRDATEAFNDLVVGVGRGSRLILDNLGILIKENEAYQKLADSIGKTTDQLTFQEKALYEISLRSEELGQVTLNAGDAFTQLSTSVENAFNQFVTGLASSEELAKALGDINIVIAENNFEEFGRLIADEIIAPIAEAVKYIIQLKDALSDFFGLAKDVVKTLPMFGGEIDGLTKRFEKLLFGDLDKINNFVPQSFKKATEEVKKTSEAVKELSVNIESVSKKSRSQSVVKSIIKPLNNDVKEVTQTFSSGLSKATIDVGKELNNEFGLSANFLEDSLRTVVSGGNIFDEWERQLENIAIKFGSNLLQQLIGGSGSGLSSLLGGSGGAGGGLSSLLGGGGSLINPASAIALGATFAAKETQELFSSFKSGTAGSRQGAEAGQALGLGNIRGVTDRFGASQTGFASLAGQAGLKQVGLDNDLAMLALMPQAYLAQKVLDKTAIGGAISKGFSSALGGSTDVDELQRRAIRSSIQERTGLSGNLDVNTFAGGGVSIGSQDYNVDFSNKLAGSAVAGTKGLARAFAGAGASEKAVDDVTGMFSNTVLQGAKDLSDVMLNISSLASELGVSFQELKTSTQEAFLDGQIPLDEYMTTLQNINEISAENLEGTGNIGKAMELLGENVDDPRKQLKALTLGLKEAEEIGITSMSGLGAYLVDQLGPEAAEVFQNIENAGIKTWQDVEEANADELAVIFSNLNRLQDEFKTTFVDATDEAAQATDENMQRIIVGLENSSVKAKDLTGDMKKLAEETAKVYQNNTTGAGVGADPNKSMYQKTQ